MEAVVCGILDVIFDGKELRWQENQLPHVEGKGDHSANSLLYQATTTNHLPSIRLCVFLPLHIPGER